MSFSFSALQSIEGMKLSRGSFDRSSIERSIPRSAEAYTLVVLIFECPRKSFIFFSAALLMGALPKRLVDGQNLFDRLEYFM